MNGISLSQGINEKAAQVDFNGRSRLMPRQIQIKPPSPQVNHNDTKQAKDIIQIKSKITTNNTVSCDYADINAKLSEKSDPPEDKPGRPYVLLNYCIWVGGRTRVPSTRYLGTAVYTRPYPRIRART